MEDANLERHHRTNPRLARRNRDLRVGRSTRPIRLDVIATEEFDRGRRRWKVDGHLVDKRPPERARVWRERFEREGRSVSTRP
jgi:hypothetical protein